MALDIDARGFADRLPEIIEQESEPERLWLENIVAFIGTALAALFASSVAVLMYLA
jgi:hypothetical protein